MNATSPEPPHHDHTMPYADVPGLGHDQHGTPGHAGHGQPGGHDRHAGHSVAMFRDKFWITLLLSTPTLLWSGMVRPPFRPLDALSASPRSVGDDNGVRAFSR